MKKSLSPCPSQREIRRGLCYLAFQQLLLPGLLAAGNAQAGLSPAELNFIFFLINFLAILGIFHGFLGESAVCLFRHPILTCQAVILGYAAYYACSRGVEWIILYLAPDFSNANDASLAAMSRDGFFLMAVGTVILVPPVEECLYRGLIFRGLYDRSRPAAYLVSIAAFAFIHVMGFLGSYSLLELALAILQYIPAGLWLAWAYIKADTIFAPILIHAIVNAIGISNMR